MKENKEKITCTKCGSKGHKAHRCPKVNAELLMQMIKFKPFW